MTYEQYKRFKSMDEDEIIAKLFCTADYAINIVNECKRIHNIENPIGLNVVTTAPWINAKILEAEALSLD